MKKNWLWRACKTVLGLLIIFFVGWSFARDLRNDRVDWHSFELQPIWLAASGAVYLLGLGFSGLFWFRLLWRFGEQPRIWPAFRAYYVGHLGKYVPGKAVALVLRASLVRGPRVRFGVAALSAFYEVLTTMAAGALLAALVFTLQPPRIAGLKFDPVFIGLLLMAFAGIPVMPGVFNLLVGRLAKRFQTVESFRIPKLTLGTLMEGLLLTSCGWLLLGLSLWCAANAVAPDMAPLSWESTPPLVAAISLAYVAGFLALVVPGGLGVREFLLVPLLEPLVHSNALAIAIVLLLRLVWTAAEALMAASVYFVPVGSTHGADETPGIRNPDDLT